MKHTVAPEFISHRHHLKYLASLRDITRNNRKYPTAAEQIIWNSILKNKLLGYRFLRQKPLSKFIIDFYCSSLALAIEIDGRSHLNKSNIDKARDDFLLSNGIITIRYINDEVIHKIGWLKNDLLNKLTHRAKQLNL